MSKYKIGSKWKLTKATNTNGQSFIGYIYTLTHFSAGDVVALVRDNAPISKRTKRPFSWACWYKVIYFDNISKYEWSKITDQGTFIEDQGPNPCADAEVTLSKIAIKSSIRCTCSSRDLLHIGHKCGR